MVWTLVFWTYYNFMTISNFIYVFVKNLTVFMKNKTDRSRCLWIPKLYYFYLLWKFNLTHAYSRWSGIKWVHSSETTKWHSIGKLGRTPFGNRLDDCWNNEHFIKQQINNLWFNTQYTRGHERKLRDIECHVASNIFHSCKLFFSHGTFLISNHIILTL